MGYSAESKVVYGLVINLTELSLSNKQKKRGCSHHLDSKSAKFCSECGKPTWIEVPGSILDDIQIESQNYSLNATDSNIEFSYFTPNADTDEGILGFRVIKNYSYNNPTFLPVIQPTEEMKNFLIQICQQYNIPFEEDDFKVYSYLYESY